MAVTEPIYIATAATDAAIRAAASLANSSGGGVVKIPAGTITLSSALPMYNGVIYEGVPVWMDQRGSLTSGEGGTILTGDGTFNGFEYNATDLGTAPTDYNAFLDAAVQGAGIMDITLVNFLNGVKIGAKYNPGANYCRFERLHIVHCAAWGFWAENFINCKADKLNIVNCVVGGRAAVCSGATAYNSGNSSWTDTFVQAPATGRGIVHWARFASSLNDDISMHEQCNRSTASISQAATMSNGSANITVTTGSAFAVDLPVTVSANANGFRANQIYFVASVAGNVITLRDTMGFGTAKNATGATAVNILSRGWPAFEIAGLDASSSVTAITAHSLDLEGSTSARVVMQYANYCTIMGSFLAGSGVEYRTFCLRQSTYNSINNHPASTYDIDDQSYPNTITGTRSEYIGGNASTFTGIGLSVNNVVKGTGGNLKAQNYSGQISLRGYGLPDIYSNFASNGVGVSLSLTLDQSQITASATTIAPYDNTSSFVNAVASTSNTTLPAITNEMVGLLILFSNPQNIVHTLNTSSSQTFNGTGTSIAMPARSSVFLQASDDKAAIGKFWARFA
jgi:hypothetical protein